MSMPNEFANHLELFAALFMLSRHIHVYTNTAQGYEVYVKFTNDGGRDDCKKPVITILYRPDTRTTDGHFDVICKPSTMDWLKSDSVKNVSANNTLSFVEIFAQWQLVEPVTTLSVQSEALTHVSLEPSNIHEMSESKSNCIVSESEPLSSPAPTQPEPEILAEPAQVKKGVEKTREKEPLLSQYRPGLAYRFPSTSGRSSQGE